MLLVGRTGIVVVALLLCGLFVVVTTSLDGLCSDLPGANPAWGDLEQLLDNAPADLALLCGPFHLTNCGNEMREYKVASQRQLDIVCLNGDCILDCPLVQFRVAPQATLTLESVTLQNTIRSTIVVEPYGTLVSRSSLFRNNQGAGDGGAVYAMANSTVEVNRGRFEGNIATRGGAIYTEGSLVVRGALFCNNQAVHLGGAIYYGGKGSTANATITGAVFGWNSAAEGGPAVFSDSDVAPSNVQGTTVMGNNTGCSNHIDTSSDVTCNGIEWLRATCFSFDQQDDATVCADMAPPPTAEKVNSASPGPSTMPINKTISPPSRLPTASPLSSTAEPTNTLLSASPLVYTLESNGPAVQPPTAEPSDVSAAEPPPVTKLVLPTAQPTLSPTIAGSSSEPTTSPTSSPSPAAQSLQPTTSVEDSLPAKMPSTQPIIVSAIIADTDEPANSPTNSPDPSVPSTKLTTTSATNPPATTRAPTARPRPALPITDEPTKMLPTTVPPKSPPSASPTARTIMAFEPTKSPGLRTTVAPTVSPTA